MGRWMLPLCFALGAGFLTWSNRGGGAEGSVMVLPFVQLVFPETARDPVQAGERSIELAWALTALVTAGTAVEEVVRRVRRARRAREEADG